jgi:pimeloyl-ACP methyl ester carboxylesterase
MPFIDIHGKNIRYNRAGKGETIIFLHNGFYSTDTWNGVRKAFAKHFKIIDYDRFGYGKSDKLTRIDFDIIDEGVSELEQLTEKLGLHEFYLCGHCLGGAIALKYALKHPRKVKKIIAESVGYCGSERLLVKTDWTFQPWDAMDKNLREKLKKMHGEKYSKEFWNIIREYRRTYIMSIDYNILDEIKNIKCPVLIMNGDRDFYFEVEHALQAFRKMKRAELWILNRVGHDPHTEAKKEFIDTVIKFLRSPDK